MRLFLCSHFERVGGLLKSEADGKNVLFIPTASIIEEYRGYVDSARELWHKLGANIIEAEISSMSKSAIDPAFKMADIVYVSGGNTFFLIDWLRKSGTDRLIKKHLNSGKLYVGESGGAIVCAEDLGYITAMDLVPNSYAQKDFAGLAVVDFCVVPHYLCPPFDKCSKQIVDEQRDLNLCAINNDQVIIVAGGEKLVLSV